MFNRAKYTNNNIIAKRYAISDTKKGTAIYFGLLSRTDEYIRFCPNKCTERPNWTPYCHVRIDESGKRRSRFVSLTFLK